MTLAAPKNGLRPVHPGEILREDYLKPLGISANALAQSLKVPASRVNDINGVAVPGHTGAYHACVFLGITLNRMIDENFAG